MGAPQTRKTDLETETQRLGGELLTEVKGGRRARLRPDWLDRLFVALMRDDNLRVQALRFVDVMPALTDDAELVRHFREYFSRNGLPLPRIVRWGLKRANRNVPSLLIASTVRQTVRALGRRFVAGETAGEALDTAARLRARGIDGSLDMLGEATLSEAEADQYLRRYLSLITEAGGRARQWPVLDIDKLSDPVRPRANLSVKVSALYSQLSAVDAQGSLRAVGERLRPIFRAAIDNNVSLTLDMEQYEFKHIVLGAFRQLLMEPEFRRWPHIGIALQGYLRETLQDIEALIGWAQQRGAPVTVRLVRGAYWDYETVVARQYGWPVPVWAEKPQTDASYEACLAKLLSSLPHVHTAVATHNVRSIARAMALAKANGLGAGDFEFQMLYGMATRLRDRVAARGYRVRVYLPFGDLIPGMAYLVRRLLENSSSQSILRLLQIGDEAADALLQPPVCPPGKDSPRSGCAEPAQADFRNESVHRFTDAGERVRFGEALANVRNTLGRDYPFGLPVQGRPEFITSRNPANPAEIVGRVQEADQRAVEAAVERANMALPAWAQLSMDRRADYLVALASALRARRDEFAAWEVLEAGKNWREADANVVEAIDFLEYYAWRARRLARPDALSVPGETNALTYQPYGVAVVLPPWNFPLAILTGMLSAALVCGNTAVLKPSPDTPVIAAQFYDLLAASGIPEGVVTLCPGGKNVGEWLVRHPRTHLIAFTGSRAVGLHINRVAAETAGQTTHVKRVIAEMGGKNAIIVDADADWDDAIAGIVASAFGYQGQKCSACSRVIFVGGRFEAFIDRLVEAARSLNIGDPADPGNFMGPVISAQARRRILEAIAQARQQARLALEVDCSRLGDGYFIGPTLFTDVPPDSTLAQEEVFGPVLAIMRARDFGESLVLANNTAYALTGGVYSRSPANLARARCEFRVGNLYLNRKISGAIVGRQPFGGFKLSGMGNQAGGPHYLTQFLQSRTVTENTLRRGFAPDSEKS
ncbi:MAG: proline dehydrogenase family protein [Gammaproteobacteria bacterium]